MKFSSDGKMILLATNGGVIHLIDAFQGTQLHTFTVSTTVAVREIFFMPLWLSKVEAAGKNCYLLHDHGLLLCQAYVGAQLCVA